MNPSLSLLARHAPMAPVTECPQISLHQTNDVFALWQAWESEYGAIRDVPYWALVWPAARILGQYIFETPPLVRGKSVLDCGCGGGAAAIAAAVNGARAVTGCDLDPTAAFIAQRNAAANGVAVDIVCQDVITCCDPKEFNLILVADLFYQQEFSQRLLTALRHAHAQGCDVIIADSGRPFLPKEDLAELYAQGGVGTSFDVEGCVSRTVRLFRFRQG